MPAERIEKLTIEASRLWYRAPDGKRCVALQYEDDRMAYHQPDLVDPVERRTVFVGRNNGEAEPLHLILEELENYRIREAENRPWRKMLIDLEERVGKVELRLTKKRYWWRRKA